MAGKKQIILGVTASIAIYKACYLLRKIKNSGLEVKVIMTKESQEFIKPVLFESLSSNPVYSEIFSRDFKWDLSHIGLAEWASLIVIAPASANIIAKLACGICDDLLSCTVLASRAPVLIAPAMNDAMWQNPITQRNVDCLKKAGYKFAGPVKGELACGENGVGCLADVEEIFEKIIKSAK